MEGVRSVHDLHVWTVTAGSPALAAHVVVARGADRDRVLRQLEMELGENFGIEHTTLQIEEESEGGFFQVENAPANRRDLFFFFFFFFFFLASFAGCLCPDPCSSPSSPSLQPFRLLAAAPAAPAEDLSSELESKEAQLEETQHRKGVLTSTITADRRRIEQLSGRTSKSASRRRRPAPASP